MVTFTLDGAPVEPAPPEAPLVVTVRGPCCVPARVSVLNGLRFSIPRAGWECEVESSSAAAKLPLSSHHTRLRCTAGEHTAEITNDCTTYAPSLIDDLASRGAQPIREPSELRLENGAAPAAIVGITCVRYRR